MALNTAALRALLTAWLLLSSPAAADVPRWVKANEAVLLDEYRALLAIPNVASDTPNIRRNADHIAAMMQRRGLAPQLLESRDPSAPPAIYGEWRVPGAHQTLVLYAHYDGQPVDPADWTVTAPFAPKLLSGPAATARPVDWPAAGTRVDADWRIYGRSASDDKAGVFALLAAIDALRATGARPAFNIKLFFDGEEEAGSPHLAEILAGNHALLRSDGWIIVDGPAHASGIPQAVLGVRGIVGASITTYGAVRPLHSGHYGNWSPNPGMQLARLLASMKDENGRVLIEGFYDDVKPLTSAEQAILAEVPDTDEALRAELGVAGTEGGGGTLAELLQLPSLNVAGLRSADVGERARNVIPTTATAAIDMRLVLGNDPDRQFERLAAHVRAQGFHVIDRAPTMAERLRHPLIATVEKRPGYAAERTPLADPLAQRLVAGMRAGGKAVVLPTMGGSLPLYLIREALGTPTVTMALWNHDNNQHAEDENLRLGNLWDGIAAIASVMTAK